MENKLILINQSHLTITGIKKAAALSENSLTLQLENQTLNVCSKTEETRCLRVASQMKLPPFLKKFGKFMAP